MSEEKKALIESARKMAAIMAAARKLKGKEGEVKEVKEEGETE